MNSGWFTVLGTVIGFLGAAWIGWQNHKWSVMRLLQQSTADKERAHTQWLKDQRIKSYADLLTAVHVAFAGTHSGTVEDALWRTRVDTVRAISLTRLVAGEAVLKEMDAFNGTLLGWYVKAGDWIRAGYPQNGYPFAPVKEFDKLIEIMRSEVQHA